MAAPIPPTEPRRGRANRAEPGVRRGLILDAAERLFAEGDPLLVTFDELAAAAGVSRALLYRYIRDRRDLHDAVQARIVERLGDWVEHGFGRAADPAERLRALVFGLWSFVESDPEAWRVLAVTAGFDHPNFHRLKRHWADGLMVLDQGPGPQLAVSAAVGAISSLVARGADPNELIAMLEHLL